ncbi:unnamed protein product [Amoebophrya sp. A120]|nr:unnamed protein product [Amoebophrya sp. A120]|eukprot:GSA120T00019342001.1
MKATLLRTQKTLQTLVCELKDEGGDALQSESHRMAFSRNQSKIENLSKKSSQAAPAPQDSAMGATKTEGRLMRAMSALTSSFDAAPSPENMPEFECPAPQAMPGTAGPATGTSFLQQNSLADSNTSMKTQSTTFIAQTNERSLGYNEIAAPANKGNNLAPKADGEKGSALDFVPAAVPKMESVLEK